MLWPHFHTSSLLESFLQFLHKVALYFPLESDTDDIKKKIRGKESLQEDLGILGAFDQMLSRLMCPESE